MTLAFVCFQLDTGLEIFQLIPGQFFFTIWVVTRGEGGLGKRLQTVIEGSGSKIGIFTVTYSLNGPVRQVSLYSSLNDKNKTFLLRCPKVIRTVTTIKDFLIWPHNQVVYLFQLPSLTCSRPKK